MTTAVETKVAAKPEVEAAPKVPSKLSICRTIFAANPTLTRKDMIAKFVSEAGATEKGAATYYATCKKEASDAQADKSAANPPAAAPAAAPAATGEAKADEASAPAAEPAAAPAADPAAEAPAA